MLAALPFIVSGSSISSSTHLLHYREQAANSRTASRLVRGGSGGVTAWVGVAGARTGWIAAGGAPGTAVWTGAAGSIRSLSRGLPSPPLHTCFITESRLLIAGPFPG